MTVCPSVRNAEIAKRLTAACNDPAALAAVIDEFESEARRMADLSRVYLAGLPGWTDQYVRDAVAGVRLRLLVSLARDLQASDAPEDVRAKAMLAVLESYDGRHRELIGQGGTEGAAGLTDEMPPSRQGGRAA